MKFPLSNFQTALREICCYFFGHNWKSSWRRRRDINWETPEEEVSYALRQSGNQFFEYSLGWRYKCRRCREQTRGDAWNPWYKVYFWAIKCSVNCFFSAIKFAREDEIRNVLWLLPYACLSATSQFFAHMTEQPHWPCFFLGTSVNLEWKVMERLFVGDEEDGSDPVG